MTFDQAYKIAQPLLKNGVVCVLSNGAAFIVNSNEDKESVSAFAKREKLEVFIIDSKLKVAEDAKEVIIEASEPIEDKTPKKKTKKKA